MDVHQAFEVLQIESSASQDEIKTAYRKMALESHPDKSEAGDDQKFKMVSEAYHLLKDYKGDKKKSATVRKSPGPKAQWGAPKEKRTPEEDWGRFTREFESENPSFWAEYERKFWEEYNTSMAGGTQRNDFEKTREPRRQPNLSVEVDPSLCIGCCSCEIIAPEVFEVDKKSHMNPKSRVINRRGAKYNKIINAAETCPTKAIIVDNLDADERIYPL